MKKEAEVHEGGCICGHVRYRMTSDPMIVHCCHCRWCQRETGTAFALNALIEAEHVDILQGNVEVIVTPSQSGAGQKISRCPTCRVAVWSNYALSGGIEDLVFFIRVGTLEDPDRFPPDVHIYTGSKQPWFKLPSKAAAFEEYYTTSEVWLEKSLKRRAALGNKT